MGEKVLARITGRCIQDQTVKLNILPLSRLQQVDSARLHSWKVREQQMASNAFF